MIPCDEDASDSVFARGWAEAVLVDSKRVPERGLTIAALRLSDLVTVVSRDIETGRIGVGREVSRHGSNTLAKL